MDCRTISEIFDEVLAGSDTDELFRDIAALSDGERATLLNALEYVEANAACEGRGREVRAILDKFGDGRR
jgi:hypothetical protein